MDIEEASPVPIESRRESEGEESEASDNESHESEGEDSEGSDDDDESHVCVFTNYLTRLAQWQDISQVLATVSENPQTATSLSTTLYNALDSVIIPPYQPPTTQQPILPSTSTPLNHDILTALKDISSKLDHFHTNIPTLPENTNVADTQHVARQIAHWASLFISMFQCTPPPVAPLSGPSASVISPSASSPVPPSNLQPSQLTLSPVPPSNLQPSPSTSSPVPPSNLQPSPSTSSPVPPSNLQPSPSTSSPVPPSNLQPSQPTLSPVPPSNFQPSPSTSSPVPPSNLQPSPSTSSSVPPLSSSTLEPQVDKQTFEVYKEYGYSGHSNVSEWLSSLHIPRNVENLQQVKDIWEVGARDCPPLKKWTAKMRRPGGSGVNHSSIFNLRKKQYYAFKECNFNEDQVQQKYHEVRPGKLYKILLSKGH